MAKKLDFDTSWKQEPQQKVSQKCMANNCPLTWVAPTSGHHQGVCSFHNGVEAMRWPAITQNIIENMNIYDIYIRVMRMGDGDFDQKRRQFGHVSVPPEENENGKSYRARLLGHFRQLVTQ